MTISPALFPAVTVTVVRDRKIWSALRTNQIPGFVTVPSWKKKRNIFCNISERTASLLQGDTYLLLTEFEVRTVSYGPRFPSFDLWLKREARRP